ncbi:SRPBCC family protein [Streptomyces sp. NRRL S-37]|uniref:SRPBCC family protein n=1 Tax=Streptomyces sp. NRRL S-37 TaxID=1463903 RepID=UPI0004C55D45|nr:SRPBCC domain-containing protein [Streptomyces sp. NRRL S-37]
MEHEVFVPVEAERLREVLDDPARVARAVPGLQHDAGADPVAGRLKIRVGGHSVTYRGAVRVSARDDGSYAVEGEAAEARGSGSVKLALRLRVRSVEGGTALVVSGTASADGRVTGFPADAVASAVARLLNRFAENLGADAAERGSGEPESPELLSTGDFEPRATDDFETTPDAEDAAVPAPGDPAPAPDEPASAPETEDVPSVAPDAEDVSPSVFDAEVPASSFEADDDSVAEAAHARRTMIGRSAEEVDHAPPRGRYAPVPAPQTVASVTPLRWAAPAAALAVASVVVAVRALRRRH